jgi:NTE family protein
LLTGGPALATAEAVLDTVALALPFRAFRDILENHPAAALPLARLLGRRLQAFSSRRSRRHTSVFIGVATTRAGARQSLLVSALAQAMASVTSSGVLVLDFDYGGPIPAGPGPGVVRAMEEILDARGHVRGELLNQRRLRCDDRLSFLIFALHDEAWADLAPEVFAELLGEAKRMASYVLIRVPPHRRPGVSKLLEQLEHLVVALTPQDLDGGAGAELLGELGDTERTVGLLLGEGEESPGPAEFLAATGHERGFVFPASEVAERSILRLAPYPREALDEAGEAERQARSVVRIVTRRRFGVCLGSGTALGWAHVGVIRVLRQAGIPIDCISGSSMGSIIASMVASGFDDDRMTELVAMVDQKMVDSWADYNWPLMRDGLLRGDQVSKYLQDTFGDRRIEDMEIPLVIQATDLLTGKPYFFRSGPVVPAIRASVSLPGVFRPVDHDEHLLVDGGVHDTLPTGPLRALGADLVLAVNTTQSPEFNQVDLDTAKGYNVFDLFLRSLEIMQTRRTGFEAQSADLVIQPRIRGADWRELWRGEEILTFGVEAAERMLDQILGLLRRPPARPGGPPDR